MIRRVVGSMEAFADRVSKRLTREGLQAFIAAEVGGLRPGARVMSVGAGGQVSEFVRTAGEALDLALLEIDIDPDRKPDLVADLCDLPFADHAFDAILVLEVMEHVKTPATAVSEMRRVLAPGGRLIWSTPFLFPVHDAPFDFFRYTRFGIKQFLTGFDAVSITEKMGPRLTLLALRSRLARDMRRTLAPLGFVEACWISIQAPLARAIDRRTKSHSAPLGYFVTATKAPLAGDAADAA